MSDYKQVNGHKTRLCNYECGTLIWWDNSKSVFIEEKGEAVHTPERCKSIKESKQTKQEITLEMVQRKLASIGITLDLDKLMNRK